MNLIDVMIASYEFNRTRTLATLDRIEKLDQQAALAWRPGPGRAHLGWQFMHVGITEDLFASERLAPGKRSPKFQELWERFRGGSTPDDNPVSLDQIRDVLATSRASLLETLGELSEDDLDEIPAGFAERGLPLRTVLQIIGWHESHHQGQAHITLNLFENQ